MDRVVLPAAFVLPRPAVDIDGLAQACSANTQGQCQRDEETADDRAQCFTSAAGLS